MWPAPWPHGSWPDVFAVASHDTEPFKPSEYVLNAVVISADLMAAGDQSGCCCLSSAATPATCGLAIEVPE